MNVTVIVACISFLGTVLGSVIGAVSQYKAIVYRIDCLEKKVSKHNNLIERTFVLESDARQTKREISSLDKRVLTLEGKK